MNSVNIILSEEHIEGTQATVNQWLYSIGDMVKKNQPLVELETDKVMMEVIAPESGKLTKILINNGETVEANSTLGVIDANSINKIFTSTAKQSTKPEIAKEIFNSTPSTISSGIINTFISPSVRRLSKKHNIDLNSIEGTGKNKRVTTRDILTFLNTKPLIQNSTSENINSEIIPISNMRRNIAKHMVQSLLHTAPHVTSVFNLDLSTIIAHRKLHKQTFADQGANLTFTAYFIAASTMAIKSVPIINSQLHKDSIEIFKNINIGIGTALADKGLIVPVIKNCQNKDLLTIAQNLTSITEKARNNNLSPIDVQNGTFTISNHGVSGSLIATPIIINQPQSAILGIGKMEKRVVVKEVNNDDVIVIKPMCYVSLTIDHRVLDAHQTNQFLSVFVDILENWNSTTMD